MNILFLSLMKFSSFEEHNIYTDLLRTLVENGHNVYAVSPSERRNHGKTNLLKLDDNAILMVKTFNIQKTNVIEKGIGTLAIKGQFIRAIKKYFKGIKFDLILYPTPPITLYGVVKYFKKRDHSKTYLMLKDIFPQNAVDIGLLSKKGLKGFLYRFFRKQERKLYAISDKIGCMSPANVDYVLNHNPEVDKNNIGVFPNCIEIQNVSLSAEDKRNVRISYGLPLDKKVFVYGGNLGKPQGIPFIIECLKNQVKNKDVFFLIVGDGTQYRMLEDYANESKQSNFKLMKRLSSDSFDKVLASSDVGLIFLDHRFTIPNFPSRLLSYMQASLPVLACTDTASDVGKVITGGNFGWWCESNNVNAFTSIVDDILKEDLTIKGNNSLNYLKNNYNVKNIKLEV